MNPNNDLRTTAEIVAQNVVNYYQQLTAFAIPVTEVATWFAAQLREHRTILSAIAPSQWQLLPAFRRHALEARGYSMLAYMQEHLTIDQLPHWIDDGDGGVRPA